MWQNQHVSTEPVFSEMTAEEALGVHTCVHDDSRSRPALPEKPARSLHVLGSTESRGLPWG